MSRLLSRLGKSTNVRRLFAMTLVFLMVFSTVLSSGFGTLSTAYAAEGSDVSLVKSVMPDNGTDADHVFEISSPIDIVEEKEEVKDDVEEETEEEPEEEALTETVSNQAMNLPLFAPDKSALNSSDPYVKVQFAHDSSVDDGWTVRDSDASIKIRGAFFLEVKFYNPSSSPLEADFLITGEHLDTVEFPELEMGVETVKYTSPEGVQYKFTLTDKDADGKPILDDQGNPALNLHCVETAHPNSSTLYAEQLILYFKSHSNGGSVSIDPEDAFSDTSVISVAGVARNPSLTTASSKDTSEFYQWLADRDSQTFRFTSNSYTNSDSDSDIAYLQSATLTQTVTYNRFALTEQPVVTASNGVTITHKQDTNGNYSGYVATITKEASSFGALDSSMPAFSTYVTVRKNEMVEPAVDGSGSQGLSAATTLSAGVVNGTGTINGTGSSATTATKQHAVVSWTIDGVDGSNPGATRTRTNFDPGTTNVAQYNITTKYSSLKNTAVFVFQGEGTPGSSTNAVNTSFKNFYDHKITSLAVKKVSGSGTETIINGMADAFNRGMLDKKANGDFFLKYDAPTNQWYMPINDAGGSILRGNTVNGYYMVEISIETTQKLDANGYATDGTGRYAPGTTSAVRFFMSNGTGSDSQYPLNNSPVNSRSGYVTSFYKDVTHVEAELGIAKTGAFNAATSAVTYQVTLTNNGAQVETGSFVDNWPSTITLRQMKGIAGSHVKITFNNDDNDTYEFDWIQANWPKNSQGQDTTYTPPAGKAVTKIEISGFSIPAATYEGETLKSPGKRTVTIVGETSSNTPFTEQNSVSTGGGGGNGNGGGHSASVGLVLADAITKRVFSNPECTDPIDGVETVVKGTTVYFQVRINNTSQTGEAPHKLPFILIDKAQEGMTLKSAKYNGADIPLSSITPLPSEQASANSPVFYVSRYPEVEISGGKPGSTGTWVMEYEVDDTCPAGNLLNKAYAITYAGTGEARMEFSTQTASASITVVDKHYAEISITKRVSPYVYYGGAYYYWTNQKVWALGTSSRNRKSNVYAIGDYVLYEISVKNGDVLDSAPIRYIYDTIPQGLEFVGLTAGQTGGSQNPNPGRYGYYQSIWELWRNSGNHPAFIFSPTQNSYAVKVRLADFSSGLTSAYQPYAGRVRYDAELTAEMHEANPQANSGKTYFTVTELDGSDLYIEPNECFTFYMVCKVADATQFEDANGNLCYRNVAGAQSEPWAVPQPDPEDPTKDNVEAQVDIYQKSTSATSVVEKRCTRVYNGSWSTATWNGYHVVSKAANLRYDVRVENKEYPNTAIESIQFTDTLPSNYRLSTRTNSDGNKWLVFVANEFDSSGYYLFEDSDAVSYDPDTNVLTVNLTAETNLYAFEYVKNTRYAYFSYYVVPTEEAQQSYHTDTNYVELSNGAMASWTTYALGVYGVSLHKSQTIRGTKYTGITPVPVREKEEFRYTLSSRPAYDKGRFVIEDIVFTDTLPNLNDGRDSEFSVAFADPDDLNDVTVTITKADDSVVTVTNTAENQYYTVSKNGYDISVSFSDLFEADYCGLNGILANCKSFDVSFPVKAEVLSDQTSDGASPFNADGDNKVARNTYHLAYKLYENGTLAADVSIDSNEVDVETAAIKGSVEAEKVLVNADSAPAQEKVFTFTLTAGENTAGDDIGGDPIETPMPAAASITLNGEGTATFGNIPFVYAGVYNYTITETDPGAKWQQSGGPVQAAVKVEGSVAEGDLRVESVTYTNGDRESSNVITNTYQPNIDIQVIVSWDDDNNHDKLRPKQVIVKLMKDKGKTLVASANLNASSVPAWSCTFKNLPATDSAGSLIDYSIAEDPVPDAYTVSYDGDAAGGFTITNTHAREKRSVNVTIEWRDFNDESGLRPGSVTIQLYADGVEADGKTLTLEEASNWSGTFSNLDKYDSDGHVVSYTVDEKAVSPGYIRDSVKPAGANSWKIVNRHMPTVSVDVAASWNDSNDAANIRPASVTVKLKANGTVVPDKTLTLTGPSWSGTLSDLDKYDSDGQAIVYTVVEDPVPSWYTAAYSGDAASGFTITNTHTIAPAQITLSGTKTFTGWPAGASAPQVPTFSFTLSEGGSVLQTKTTQGTGSFSFDSITYTTSGTHIYTVAEVQGDQKGVQYSATVYQVVVNVTYNTQGNLTATIVSGANADGSGLDFSNTYSAHSATLNLSGTKTFTGWPEGETAPTFTYTLTGSGQNQTKQTSGGESFAFDPITYSSPGTYVHTVAELAGSVDGVVYDAATYTVTVVVTDRGTGQLAKNVTITKSGSDGSISPDALNFANEYATVNIDGEKTWADDDDRDGIRPDHITVNLLRDGAIIDSKAVGLNEADGTYDWTYSWTGLYKYAPGATSAAHTEYTYSVSEETIPVESGHQSSYTPTYDGFDILNTHDPDLVSIPVMKVWDDYKNQYNTRPDHIIVKLLADDSVIRVLAIMVPKDGTPLPDHIIDKDLGKVAVVAPDITMQGGNTWIYIFNDSDLYKYRDGGQEIRYTVEEVRVGLYAEPSIKPMSGSGGSAPGYVITNTYRTSGPPINPEGSLRFQAAKELAGADLEEDMFLFELYEGAHKLQTKANKADGSILFDEIFYGVDDIDRRFVYEVKEVAGTIDGMIYDQTVYTITVDVKYNGTDKLKIIVSGAEDIVFHNEYVNENASEVASVNDDGPGDPGMPYGALAGAGALGLLGAALLGKKREEE